MPDERKVVTVLFADLVSSTVIGEQLDPEQLRALLQRYFAQMAEAVESRGGTVEKYIGDAIMAVFGVPRVREDDAERALDAALDMIARVERLAAAERVRNDVELAIRVGVNTGEVIVPVGDLAAQLIVTGDAVNTTARLEQAAQPGRVLVGERTWLATRAAFDFEDPTDLELKGKREPVTAHPLRGRAAERRPRGVPGLSAPMIGRERELVSLSSALAEALEARRPRMALIFGNAGIGKSRLVRESLRMGRAEHGDLTVVEGRCLAAGQGITFWALGEILRAASGITLADTGDVARERLTAAVERVLAPLALPAAEVTRTILALALTAGIALRDNPLERRDPAAVAEELAVAWPRFITAMATRSPVVMVIEDLHWAGDPLLRMLARIATRADGPILILATARPEVLERTAQLMPGADPVTISLRPLGEQQSVTLIDSLLASTDLPPLLRQEVVDRADGNPFFLEEILRRLIDEGGLVREDGHWRATPAAHRVAVPDTVQGLLAARIDALEPSEKLILQQASVVGRGFWEGSLVGSGGGDGSGNDGNGSENGSAGAHANGPAPRELLERLEEKGLVLVRPVSTLEGQTEYAFRHALVREVAYAGLPKAQRARLHARVGDWLEALARDRRDEVIELVSYHLRSAVVGDGADIAWGDDEAGRERLRRRAFEALLRAATVARQRNAVDKALELDTGALELAIDDRERADALEGIGEDHEAAFHGDEALATYLQALEAARTDPAGSEQRARMCRRMSFLAAVKWGGFRTMADPADIDAWVDEGLAATRDPQTRGWLLASRAAVAPRWAGFRRTDPMPVEERIDAARQAMSIAEELDVADLLTVARRELVTDLFLAGDYDGAVAISEEDMASAERIDSVQQRVFTLFWNTHVLAGVRGRYTTALETARESHRLARDLSAHDRMHGTFSVMESLYHLGSWRDIPQLLDEHIADRAAEPGITCPFAAAGPVMGAMALARMGDMDAAELAVATLTTEPGREGLPDALLARYLVAAGRPQEGLALARRMIDEGRHPTVEEPPIEVLAALEALEALEDHDGLAAFLGLARATVPQVAIIGPTADRAEGRMLAARGDARAAEVLLRRAVEGFDAIGARVEAAVAREALAGVGGVPVEEARQLREEAQLALEAAGAAQAGTRGAAG